VMLGLGGSLKLWPLLLVPSIAAAYFPDRMVGRVMVLTRCGIIAVLSFLIPHLVCVWIGTRPTDAFGYLAFFGQRPFQIESVAGNFVGILKLLNVVVASPGTDFGSDNIVFDYPYILLVLWQGIAVTIIGFVCGLSLVGGGNKAFDVTSAMFVILTVVISSKVFSGEYLIWLLPVGFILVMYRDWVSVVLWLSAVATLRIVYIFWESAIHLGAAGTIAIGCKNALIIGLWVHAGRQLWRGQAVCVPWHPGTAQRGT